MSHASGEPAVLRGKIVGFGIYHYAYASGHTGEAPLVGFAPRSGKDVLYGLTAFDSADALLDQLAKHESGKGCLYLKRLSDCDQGVLSDLVTRATAHKRRQHV